MKKETWILLFAVGVVLFSWPIISIMRFGLAKYLLVVWALFIALIFVGTSFDKK